MMNIENVEWHDGILRFVNLSEGGEVLVGCDVYENENSKNRVSVQFKCLGVTSFSGIIDFIVLNENGRAGNVNSGSFEVRGGFSILKIILSDGYLEVFAKKILLDGG
jgi:hypothetical protein